MADWNNCAVLDERLLNELQDLEAFYQSSSSSSTIDKISTDILVLETQTVENSSSNDIDQVVRSAEGECFKFLEEIDNALQLLSTLGVSYTDVTSRTNTLMRSCEDLLDQQQQLQTTIDSLQEFLIPFNDIEEISNVLGIPADSRGTQAQAHLTSDLLSLDPRSTEFQNILIRLNQCHTNLKKYNNFKDYDKYQKWLDQLTTRATSLVAKAMRDLLETASSVCQDYQKKSSTLSSSNINNMSNNSIGSKYKSFSYDDQPLESAPIYQKFRGLGFRMRELASLLYLDENKLTNTTTLSTPTTPSKALNNSGVPRKQSISEDQAVSPFSTGELHFNPELILREIKQHYVAIRNALLYSFIKEVALSGLTKKKGLTSSKASQGSLDGVASQSSLPLYHGIRQAFSTLLRIAQLEHHLYSTLFPSHSRGTPQPTPRLDASSASSHTTQAAAGSGSSYQSAPYSDDVLQVIENVNNIIIDCIRPLLIAESSIDELCRIISVLNEDIRSQFLGINAAADSSMKTILIAHLDRIVNDAQERLSYCAETYLRLHIQVFDPLPSQLAYPDILENARTQPSTAATVGVESTGDVLSLDTSAPVPSQKSSKKDLVTLENDNTIENGGGSSETSSLTRSWYPPLRSTLSLLSKLYGVVDMAVFEDFARRSVRLCIQVLLQGGDRIRRKQQATHLIHGDLFLIRY